MSTQDRKGEAEAIEVAVEIEAVVEIDKASEIDKLTPTRTKEMGTKEATKALR